MPSTSANLTFKDRGQKTISTEQATGALIPLDLDGVVFRQMFEYAVIDYEIEVGFFSEIFGFSVIAMTQDYALFTTPAGDFHFSLRAAGKHDTASRFDGLKLLFMTADFASAEAHIHASGLIEDAEVRNGSPSQRVLYFTSPAGLPIEIWEDPTAKGAE